MSIAESAEMLQRGFIHSSELESTLIGRRIGQDIKLSRDQFRQLSRDKQKELVKLDRRAIRYVPRHDEELQLVVVDNNPERLSDIPYPTFKVFKRAIDNLETPRAAVAFSQNLTDEMLVYYYGKYGEHVLEEDWNLGSVPKSVLISLINNDPKIISHFNNAPEWLQMAALKQDRDVFHSIRNPTKSVQRVAAQK